MNLLRPELKVEDHHVVVGTRRAVFDKGFSLRAWTRFGETFKTWHWIFPFVVGAIGIRLHGIVFGGIALLRGSLALKSSLEDGRDRVALNTCSQTAVLLPRPSLWSFCGFAWLTLITRPKISEASMLSIASRASSGSENST